MPSLAHRPAIASANRDAVTSTELLATSNVLIAAMVAHVPALAAITAKDRRTQRRHMAGVHLAAGGATLAAAIAAWKTVSDVATASDQGVAGSSTVASHSMPTRSTTSSPMWLSGTTTHAKAKPTTMRLMAGTV